MSFCEILVGGGKPKIRLRPRKGVFSTQLHWLILGTFIRPLDIPVAARTLVNVRLSLARPRQWGPICIHLYVAAYTPFRCAGNCCYAVEAFCWPGLYRLYRKLIMPSALLRAWEFLFALYGDEWWLGGAGQLGPGSSSALLKSCFGSVEGDGRGGGWL